MYLPGKYSKFSGTGSAKPGGCLFRSQNVGNSQNSAAYPRWKTGRSSQANGTLWRCLSYRASAGGYLLIECRGVAALQMRSSQ